MDVKFCENDILTEIMHRISVYGIDITLLVVSFAKGLSPSLGSAPLRGYQIYNNPRKDPRKQHASEKSASQ